MNLVERGRNFDPSTCRELVFVGATSSPNGWAYINNTKLHHKGIIEYLLIQTIVILQYNKLDVAPRHEQILNSPWQLVQPNKTNPWAKPNMQHIHSPMCVRWPTTNTSLRCYQCAHEWMLFFSFFFFFFCRTFFFFSFSMLVGLGVHSNVKLNTTWDEKKT